MRISGFSGTSLLDYPEKICSIIYTSSCNFRCPYCHNPSLVGLDSEDMDIDEIINNIEERRDFIDAVTITGGEPTIHRDLGSFISRIKNVGLLVKLDTNGYNPEMLKSLFKDKLIDYVAMDIKSSPKKYWAACGTPIDMEKISTSVEVVMNAGVEYEFRTTAVPELVSSEDFYEIGEMIKGAEKYIIQQYDNKNTLDKSYTLVKSYTEKELEEFMEIMKNYAKSVKIYNIALVV